MRWVHNDLDRFLTKVNNAKPKETKRAMLDNIAEEGKQLVLEQWQGSASVYTKQTAENVQIIAQDISEKPHVAYMEFGIGEKGKGTYPGELPKKGVPLTGAWEYHYPSNKKITTKSGKRGWILRLDKGTKPLYRFFQGYAAKAPMYHAGENIKEYIKEQLVIDLNRGE